MDGAAICREGLQLQSGRNTDGNLRWLGLGRHGQARGSPGPQRACSRKERRKWSGGSCAVTWQVLTTDQQ